MSGLLAGLARGPVDPALVHMVEDHYRGLYATKGSDDQESYDPEAVGPPDTDDPEATLSDYEPIPEVTPAQVRRMKRAPVKFAVPAKTAAAREKLVRPTRANSTPSGTDDDLKDASSGGRVLRLDR